MYSLRRLIASSVANPTKAQRKDLEALLWRVGTRQRPTLAESIRRSIREEFDHRCARCRRRISGLEIHHIVPWREALLLADGDHSQREYLIPLCNAGCHDWADEERVPRDVLFSWRNTKALPGARRYRPLLEAAEFEIGIARGNHRQLHNAYEADGRKARSNAFRAKAFVLAASAARRAGSEGMRQSLGLLNRAQDQLGNSSHDDETRALIQYERGKNAVLRNEFGHAGRFYDDAGAMTSNDLMSKQARHSKVWAFLRKEKEGADAPEVSLQAECGIDHFEAYRNDAASSISGIKWYVYNLLDGGQHLARIGDWKTALERLADAQDWIDKLGLKALRAQLYRNVSLACHARQDYWRAALAASASLALHHEMGLQEHKGLTLLAYVQALQALEIKGCVAVAARERIDREMDNQWALGELEQFSLIR